MPSKKRLKPRKVLAVDVGGSHVKMMVTGGNEIRRFVSGPRMTARQMVLTVKKMVSDWNYDVVSIGYPGPVVHGMPLMEPYNLGKGWVRFNFREAFGRPVKVVNDAAMQALGSYEGGRMLFLGLGTGLGSAMIADGILQPMELAHLPYRKGKTYEEFLGEEALERHGKKKWTKHVLKIVGLLATALEVDYVVLGGGNVELLKSLPPKARRGDNKNAFIGGFRMWEEPNLGDADTTPSASRKSSRKPVERK